MQWLELKIDTTPAGLTPVSDLVEGLGITGLVIEDEGDFLEGFLVLYDLAHTGVVLEVVLDADAAEVFPEEVEVTLCCGVSALAHYGIEAFVDDFLDGGVLEHIEGQPHFF